MERNRFEYTQKDKDQLNPAEFDERSLPPRHPLILYAKFTNFIKLALAFVVISLIPTAVLIYSTDYTWADPLTYIFPVIALFLAVKAAVKIEKKNGLEDIDSHHFFSKDISELTKDKDKKTSQTGRSKQQS